MNTMKEFGKDSQLRIENILSRAATDIVFRNLLLEKPEEALCDSDLTTEERKLVSNLRRVQLEELGLDVRRFRSFLRDNGTKV